MKSLTTAQITIDNIESMDEIPLILFKDLVGKGKVIKPQIQRCSEEKKYLQKEMAILTRTVDILKTICVNYGQNIDENQPTNQQMMNTQNLHEARTLLAEIEQTLKQKRQMLQPKVQELNQLKRQQTQLETDLQI